MDCEQFDQIVVDLLYGELGEADATASKRHVERCDRCSNVLAGLRRARQATSLALQEPPVGFEEAILERARRAQREIPWPRKVGRAISWAGSYAMRPQLAMAALLLLMIGSSLLLLRQRPGAGQMGMVRITEHGTPQRDGWDGVGPAPVGRLPSLETMSPARPSGRREQAVASDNAAGAPLATDRPSDRPSDKDGVRETAEGEAREGRGASPIDEQSAIAQRPATGGTAEVEPGVRGENVVVQGQEPAPTPSAAVLDGYAEAMAMYRAKEYAKAYRAFDAVAAQGGRNAPMAALYAAVSVRASSGCSTAISRMEGVMSRYGNSPAGLQAKWEAASCYRSLGNNERARQLLAELQEIDGQRDRADRELARGGPPNRAQKTKSSPAKKTTTPGGNVDNRTKAAAH